ncbi:MAG: TIGR03435 family protein [Acidobacteriaceae bacterium]|jgi:uncharacterized protein (TIGR03435 family)
MLTRRTLLLAAAASLALPGPLAHAQATAPQPAAAPAKPLVFETASIRPSKSTPFYTFRFTPDGFTATGVSLKVLIRNAYNEWHDQRWSGEPAWLDSTAYAIEAKFDPADFKDLTDDQRRAMLQNLLAERFKFVLHHETRELPEYALLVNKGGPKLRLADAEKYMRDSNNQLYCRAGLSGFRQCTMAEFASDAGIVGIDRIVVDRTGLTGRYDFELHYRPAGMAVPDGTEAPPSIYDALQEELNLRLQPIKGPVDVLVIDHVEKPSEN